MTIGLEERPGQQQQHDLNITHNILPNEAWKHGAPVSGYDETVWRPSVQKLAPSLRPLGTRYILLCVSIRPLYTKGDRFLAPPDHPSIDDL